MESTWNRWGKVKYSLTSTFSHINFVQDHLLIAICNNVGEAAFLGQNQKFKNESLQASKLVISSCINMILRDLERYTKGLPEYVKI